jgi:hypothetical protein
MRMPAAVVLAAVVLAFTCGLGSEAASSGDLLLFDNATASIVVKVAPCKEAAAGSIS